MAIRILQNFNRQRDGEVLATAGAVIKGLADDPAVDVKAIETAAREMIDAIAAMPHSGVAGTAVRDNKRGKLIALLKKAAHHVQDNCSNDQAKVFSAGFTLKSQNRLSAPLAVPSHVTIDFGKTTELVIKVKRILNVRCYEVRVAEIGAGGVMGSWQTVGTFTTSRGMTITGLASMTTYLVQVRAIGTAGPTDWSDPVSHPCV